MSDSKPISFVTGATGFLGHHLCSQLIEAGHEVHALVRDPGSEAAQRLPDAVKLTTGNILDAEGLPALVAASGAKWFFHSAGMVSRDAEDAVAMHEANVSGTKNALAAAKSAGVERFIHASTSGTIGISRDENHVASESDPTPTQLINRWPYYRTKLYAEQIVLDAADDALEVVIVNPSLLLGPGDLHASSTEDVRRFLEQRVPLTPAGGYSFVDARDAATGMIRAAERGRNKERYLLTACNCTVRTFFNRVARVAGMDPPLLSLPTHPRAKKLTLSLVRAAHKWIGEDESVPDPDSIDMAQHYWYVDASKAEQELEWSSRDAMATLADTVTDLRERGLVMMAPPK
jgi:dihydroflavonol-4-reductase